MAISKHIPVSYLLVLMPLKRVSFPLHLSDLPVDRIPGAGHSF